MDSKEKAITDIWAAYKRGTIKVGDVVRAPKGKGFVIYRGDALYYDERGKRFLYSKWKKGKAVPFLSRAVSFSTSINIAKEFARGIAKHYGKQYKPILIKAVCSKVQIGTSPFEKEVYPMRGKSKVVEVKVLGN